MQLDAAVFKHGIVRGKVGFAPGAMTVVIAVSSAACATAESTTISRSVVLVVRHVSAAVSKTWKVNAGPAECNSESSAASITQTVTRSAQIEHAVSVHQGSLIRQASRDGVRWACMNVVCCSENCARV